MGQSLNLSGLLDVLNSSEEIFSFIVEDIISQKYFIR